jgi:hypothetical protein
LNNILPPKRCTPKIIGIKGPKRILSDSNLEENNLEEFQIERIVGKRTKMVIFRKFFK